MKSQLRERSATRHGERIQRFAAQRGEKSRSATARHPNFAALVLSTPRNAGSLDDKIYTMAKYEKVQEWLMDPDLCPTNWDVLHSIRAQNPESHARRTPAGASPTPSQM